MGRTVCCALALVGCLLNTACGDDGRISSASTGTGGGGAGTGGAGGGAEESCVDGADDDGDGLVDCADSDCAEACADACAAPTPLGDPSSIDGDLTGHGDSLGASCASTDGSGPDLAFVFVPAQSGTLRASLQSDADLTLSVRSSCTSGEVVCVDDVLGDGTEALEIAVEEGDELYVVVDGFGADDAGAFKLDVETLPSPLCEAAVAVADPSSTEGDTAGGTSLSASSCQPGSGSVSERVFAVTPIQTGVLDVSLRSDADLGFSVRGACAAATGELACVDEEPGGGAVERASVEAQAGETLYVVVDGFSADDEGAFTLEVASRVPACGDGELDPGEECDDGGDAPGDGCSPTCALTVCVDAEALTTSLVEAGDNTLGSNLYDTSCQPPGGRERVFTFVPADSGVLDLVLTSSADLGLAVRTTCDDPDAEIGCADEGFGANTTERLSVAVSDGVPVWIVVNGYEAGEEGAFELALATRPAICGDEVVDPGEECDDGNEDPGDGCDAACQGEFSEIEPNGTAATAETLAQPWLAAIAPAGDVDWLAVDVPGSSSTLTAEVVAGLYTQCGPPDGAIDSEVDIVAPDGTTVLATSDDVDIDDNWCSRAVASGLAAGTYYVRVAASSQFCAGCTFDYELDITID